MNDSIPVIIATTFIICTVVFKLLLSLIFEKGKYEKRLRKYVFTLNQTETEKKKEAPRRKKSSFITTAAKGIESIFNLSKQEHLLIQSGVKLSPGELIIGRFLVGLLCMFFGYVRDFHMLVIIVCGVIGFYLPTIYIKNKRKKRLQKCSEQLGSALGTMANALRAGFSFMQAMKMVASEIEDPLGPEFTKALQDINYGIPVEEAFQSLLERLPDKELDLVLNTLLIQRQSGGNLAYLMETMQETIIDRTRVKEEVKTLTAQGRMSAVVITILPVALALYIKLVNPEYFQMLFSHPLGWAMVIMGCLNILLGWLFIKKIVHIEV
ncbi:type II secretion system F family protein [Lederbergia wuyishanensis]|uniref:Tight adherence protein B n=1 Tax=Lederbergia wuyishanensis TaxID=1347903 RepID=A0ABU0D8F8_9BACI|nr:type II secretion system F family protein [Lederbergia wuyishanensis]MCJ8009231.1 type II secretion system F family protein [Lederbergia wuyishanensis]MDQ0344636.1 tight adherence protein B [Lederbergia wuyishanensis]